MRAYIHTHTHVHTYTHIHTHIHYRRSCLYNRFRSVLLLYTRPATQDRPFSLENIEKSSAVRFLEQKLCCTTNLIRLIAGSYLICFSPLFELTDGVIAARIPTHNFYPNYLQFKNDKGLLFDFFISKKRVLRCIGYLIGGTFIDGKFNRRKRVNPVEKFLLVNYLVLGNAGS